MVAYPHKASQATGKQRISTIDTAGQAPSPAARGNHRPGHPDRGHGRADPAALPSVPMAAPGNPSFGLSQSLAYAVECRIGARSKRGGTHMANGFWKRRRYPLDRITPRALTVQTGVH